MLKYTAFYIIGFICLILIDFLLGNGFSKILRTIICNVTCFLRLSLFSARKRTQNNIPVEDSLTTYFLVSEILLICLVFLLLKKNKRMHVPDRLDELLQESKEALRATDEFLENWRNRRIPAQNSYLDEELPEYHPIDLEVPILRMAIVDTRVRNQPERGDAGDTLEWSSSNVISTVSFVEEDHDIDITEQTSAESRPWSRQPKYLWDVIEEDSNTEY